MLSERVLYLKKRSWHLMYISLYSLFLLPFYVFFLNYLVNVRETTDKATVVLTLSVLLFLFFLLYFSQRIVLKNIYFLFFDVQKKWSELSDKVDWTEMRKKQLYNSLDERIQKPIDEFSRYRRSILCPMEGGRNIRIFMGLLFILELFICPLITLIILL